MKDNRTLDLALLLLRLTFGGLLMGLWGKDKLLQLLTQNPVQFVNFLGLGDQISLALCVFAEVFCAALVAMGLFTRWACVPLLFNMIVAMAIGHNDQPFSAREHAITYLIPFLVIFLLGPGWYSLDSLVRRRS
jgi:putative oxidoreductase